VAIFPPSPSFLSIYFITLTLFNYKTTELSSIFDLSDKPEMEISLKLALSVEFFGLFSSKELKERKKEKQNKNKQN